MIDTEEKKYVAELCAHEAGFYPRDVIPVSYSYRRGLNEPIAYPIFENVYIKNWVQASGTVSLSNNFDKSQNVWNPIVLSFGNNYGGIVGSIQCHGFWKRVETNTTSFQMFGYKCI